MQSPAQVPANEQPSVSVALVLDDSTRGHVRAAENIQRELRGLTETTHRLRFPKGKTRTLRGSEDPERIIDAVLADEDRPALLLAVGPEASHRLATRDTLSVPVVAAHVLDPEMQGLPKEGDASRRSNLTYVSAPTLLGQNLDFLRSLRSPSAPALLVPEGLLSAAPELEARMRQKLERLGPSGAAGHVVPLKETAEETMQDVPEAVDAAYVLSPLALSPVEQDRLLSGLTARRIPTVVHQGRNLVERGALATSFAPTENPVSRRAALHAFRILDGVPAESLPVTVPVDEQPVVNEAVAERLGIPLSADVRLRATMVGAPPAPVRDSLTYADAVQRGVRANDALRSDRAGLQADREAVRVERADLLPQLQLEGQAITVNEEQAAASFGARPERSVGGSIGFSQTVFSPRETAEFAVARRERDAQEEQVRTAEKDVALQTASAYVRVLRARTAAEVQRKNLALARENLSLAEARRDAGEVGRQAVLRLRTQVAQARRAVLETEARVQVARAQLKQVLAEPMGDPVRAAPLSSQDTVLTLTEEVFARYGHTPSARNRLATFLADQGVADAPILQALDARIRAAERGVEAGQQSYWAPDVSIEGAVNTRVFEGGAGTERISLPNLPSDIPQQPSTNWNIGLSLQFPVFTGLRRDGQIDRARAEVRRLESERREARTQLEERIRSRTEQATASYLGLREAEAATATAEESLALVQESYGSGVAGVLDLLDAQEAVLEARLAEVEARHDFLLRIAQTERAISKTGPLQSPAERDAFRERLHAFMAREE